MSLIVEELEPITLVGAGSLSERDLKQASALSTTWIAVDGGAEKCLSYGVTPAAVIGDLDSFDNAAGAIPTERLHHIAEQETTDFDKALRSVAAPVILGVGFGGARLDHQLAAFSVLLTHPQKTCVLLGGEDIVFVAPPRFALELEKGTRVSLYPMAPVTGRSQGLVWPIDGLQFDPMGRLGTSNAATGGKMVVEMDAPKMLMILPRDCLETVVRQLSQPDASVWPAP